MSRNDLMDILSVDENVPLQQNTSPANDAHADLNAAVAALSTTRLPGFWRHSPESWFIHAEAIFQNQRIRADLSRVNHVVSTLDEDGVRSVADLLGPDAKYDIVKNRLINTYSIPQSTRFRSIVQPGGLGDRRPSQLLRDMRSVPTNDIGEKALKEFWLQKLPPMIRTTVIGLDGNLDHLAERADLIMDATSNHDISSVSTRSDNDRLSTIEKSILALTTQIAALATVQHSTPLRESRSNVRRNSQRSRSRSRTVPRNSAWCYYHNRFGDNAQNCREPCSFTSGN